MKRKPIQTIDAADSAISTTNRQDFNILLQDIQQARQKVFSQANRALIDLYWQIGKTISHQKLSALLRVLHPTIGNTFKDNDVLEFLGLPPVHSENRLQLPDKKLLQAKLHELSAQEEALDWAAQQGDER